MKTKMSLLFLSLLKLLKDKSILITGLKLGLNALKCSSFIVTIAIFVIDILYISIIWPFIKSVLAKEKATDKVDALSSAVKDKGSVVSYFKQRNKFVRNKLNV